MKQLHVYFSGRVQVILPEVQGPIFQTYFVYPSELRRSVRVGVLRDFLVERMVPALLDGTTTGHARAA